MKTPELYLESFKEELAAQGLTGLALDIDETLAWTVGYWFEELQKLFGNPENLSVREHVAKYRFAQKVPYWQTPEALAWMETARDSVELQEKLPLIENAHHIVEKISKQIPIAAYVTARPAMINEGTKKWLDKHAFPKAPLLARPEHVDPMLGAGEWKAGVLVDLYPTIIGIVDDNPSLIEHLPERYEGTVFLYDNTEHARTDIQVIPCKTWDDVAREVAAFCDQNKNLQKKYEMETAADH